MQETALNYEGQQTNEWTQQFKKLSNMKKVIRETLIENGMKVKLKANLS